MQQSTSQKQTMQTLNERKRTVSILPCATRQAKLKGLFLQVQNPYTDLATLENKLLELGAAQTVKFLIEVMEAPESSQSELQLASMTLLRFGSLVREDVLRYALESKNTERAWLVDFMVHQFGLKRSA